MLSPRRALFAACITVAASASADTVLFHETFESTSGTALPAGWTVAPGKFGQSDQNPIVAGLNGSARVLDFTQATTQSDTFSSTFDLSPYKNSSQQVVLTFGFLSSATNHAGLLGFSFAGASPAWVAGSAPTAVGAGTNAIFAGTGVWQTVTVDLTSFINSRTLSELQSSRLAFERWNNASVASSTPVYFDNLDITAVPEPAAAGLLTVGALLACSARRRSTRTSAA